MGNETTCTISIITNVIACLFSLFVFTGVIWTIVRNILFYRGIDRENVKRDEVYKMARLLREEEINYKLEFYKAYLEATGEHWDVNFFPPLPPPPLRLVGI